jgi:hypothetical protein
MFARHVRSVKQPKEKPRKKSEKKCVPVLTTELQSLKFCLMMIDHKQESGANKPISQRKAARILGVSQEHLNRVLKGHKRSNRLVTLYNELMTLAAGEKCEASENKRTGATK